MFAAQGAGPDASLTPPIVEAAETPLEGLNVCLQPNTEIQERNRFCSPGKRLEIVRNSSLIHVHALCAGYF